MALFLLLSQGNACFVGSRFLSHLHRQATRIERKPRRYIFYFALLKGPLTLWPWHSCTMLKEIVQQLCTVIVQQLCTGVNQIYSTASQDQPKSHVCEERRLSFCTPQDSLAWRAGRQDHLQGLLRRHRARAVAVGMGTATEDTTHLGKAERSL